MLELVELILAKGQVFQFFELIAQQLMPGALFVTAAAQTLERLPRLAPSLRGQLHLSGQFLAAAVFVEQATMGIGLEEGLVFVLAVDIDQAFAERLQVALRAWRAVDVAARTAFCGNHAAEDARPVAFQVSLLKPFACAGNVVQIEAGQDIGLVRAGPYDAAVGAIAKREAERIEHDRLARARFTGDHGHAALELEIQVFDDGVILNGQMDQHGRAPVSMTGYLYSSFLLPRKRLAIVSTAGRDGSFVSCPLNRTNPSPYSRHARAGHTRIVSTGGMHGRRAEPG